MLYIEIRNKNFIKLQEFIKENDDKAFIVVNETKYVHNDIRWHLSNAW